MIVALPGYPIIYFVSIHTATARSACLQRSVLRTSINGLCAVHYCFTVLCAVNRVKCQFAS